MGKRKKKENDTFLKKNAEENQNIVTKMIYLNSKGTVVRVKLKLEGESFA